MNQTVLRKITALWWVPLFVVALNGCALQITNEPPLAASLVPTMVSSLIEATPSPNYTPEILSSFIRIPKCNAPSADLIYVYYDWSSDGKYILLANYYAYLFELETETIEQIWPELDVIMGSFSPDAQQIALESYHGVDIYLYNFKQKLLTELINEPYLAAGYPVWSPDGQQLAYKVWSSGRRSQIWLVNISTNEKTRVPLPEYDMIGDFSLMNWSPDGKWLAFIAKIGEAKQEELADHVIYLVSDDGQKSRQLAPTHLCVADLAWSPDGKQLAFSSQQDSEWNIYVADVETGEIRQLTYGPRVDFQPNWSANGEQVLFLSVDTTVIRRVSITNVYQHDIFRINADGTGLSLVVAMNPGECCLQNPAWVPGKNAVSFLVEVIDGCEGRHLEAGCPQYIDIINSDGINRQRLVSIPKD
ncbi:MAG: PD40 domain-containing protein [Anaerolineae bacterium]|nr:PD40 domain-containing protein [Anaerolineae bacterium]